MGWISAGAAERVYDSKGISINKSLAAYAARQDAAYTENKERIEVAPYTTKVCEAQSVVSELRDKMKGLRVKLDEAETLGKKRDSEGVEYALCYTEYKEIDNSIWELSKEIKASEAVLAKAERERFVFASRLH